uniref:Secreted protein n=1 Tax=Spirodela intermedia TaxID=51605 RepID=A0A8S0XJI0_SPIIN
MRFIVALLIASLFVDKADSELSFIPRHNFLLFILVRSLRGASQNRKTHIGFRDNQARTDDFHHVKVTLYR